MPTPVWTVRPRPSANSPDNSAGRRATCPQWPQAPTTGSRLLANVSGTVSSFSELILGAKETTVETDQASASTIKDAVAYPSRQGQQTDHVVPLSVLLSVQ